MLLLALCTLACVPTEMPPPDPTRLVAQDPAVDALRDWPKQAAAYGLDGDRLNAHVGAHAALITRATAMAARAAGDATACEAEITRAEAARTGKAGVVADAVGALLANVRAGCGAPVTTSPSPAAGPCGDLWPRWITLAGSAAAAMPAAERATALVTLANDAEALAAAAQPSAAGTDDAWRAWGSCSDPLLPSEGVAPWRDDLAARTARAIAEASRAASTAAQGAAIDLLAPSSALLRAEPVVIDTTLLGTVPSPDVLVDLGGLPFAGTTRRLARMDLSDPAHRAYLEVQGNYLATVPPSELPVDIAAIVEHYDRMGHTSRWYNRAALRQAAVRSLASRKAWRPALRILAGEDALEGPGWISPDRLAGLRLVEAHVLLLLNDPAAASKVDQAATEHARFVAAVGP